MKARIKTPAMHVEAFREYLRTWVRLPAASTSKISRQKRQLNLEMPFLVWEPLSHLNQAIHLKNNDLVAQASWLCKITVL